MLFSPVFADPTGAWSGLTARELAEWILADGLPRAAGLTIAQIHLGPCDEGGLMPGEDGGKNQKR